MKEEGPLKGGDVCLICGSVVGHNDRVDVGDGVYCTTCLAGKFDPVKEIKADPVEDHSDGAAFANMFFFFLIGIPVALSFFGLPNFFIGFLAMVHEIGHFAAMIADILLPGDNWFLVVLAGSLTELMVPLMSFLYTYPRREVFVVSCLFLAASGTALIDIGIYMSSAQDPSGYAFISGQQVTYQNHDWHLIFAQLDLLDHSRELSETFSGAGHVLLYVGFYTSIAAFFAADAHKRRSGVFLYGIALSVVHTILFGDMVVTYILLALGASLFLYLRRTKA